MNGQAGRWFGLLVAAASLSGCVTAPVASRGQLTFESLEQAVTALADAARAGNAARLEAIFGPDGREVLSSGDPVADQRQREVFAVAMDQQWALVEIDGSTRELLVGDEQWPFPIRMVKGLDGWRYDTEEGRYEVLARRIGRNELAAISVCRIYVLAQRAYASRGHDGKPAGIFARKVHSTAGRHDGLYWPTASPGDPPSPLSDLAAAAEASGYGTAEPAKPRPFYGYYYRILTRQGPDAPGGAQDYLASGDMRGGCALIAWPAAYGNSGVMTFIIGDDGWVYQRDFGDQTPTIAAGIDAYNPDAGWALVQ